MNKRNFQRELDKIIAGLENGKKVPALLLHSCCAPCSSYVLEYLSEYFEITVFYYNPNIYPEEEYRKRVEEQQRLISSMPFKHPVRFEEGQFDTARFYDAVRGMEKEQEGGKRCFACYRLRLEEAAKRAAQINADYFASTLTISPLKNAEVINEIGEELAKEYGVQWLPSDFKKKNGFKRSGELSAEYGLYRQNYCGCVFSQRTNV
ncbi:MAG: epoxyqueuosine reductase QueH [Eubacteriales bacterium]|nr:epoxyqueuosine reductase QueH [Eubacteriales bacterium]